jgi:hypothetical protein
MMLRFGFVLLAACWLVGWPGGDTRCEPLPGCDLFVRAGLLVDGISAEGDEDQPVRVGGGAPEPGEKSVVRAMLLSAILPGLGEVYVAGTRGYVTGSVMAATDVFSFWQYLSNNGKGDDEKQKYKQFAAVHYYRERLGAYARDTIAVYSGSDSLGFCRPGPTHDGEKCTRQIDEHFPLSKQNDNDFYQQIDTDDYYVFGWDDWNTDGIENPETRWTGWNPGDPVPEVFRSRSANRVTFSGMRQHADDFYGKADKYAWVMVIGRVVSIVDSAILVKLRNRDLAGLGGNPRLCLSVDPTGKPDMKLALKVRF